MYEQYFGLSRTPFRLEPEPDMFYAGENQARVLKCISSALKDGKGIITLSGLPGTGKTTVVIKAVEATITSGTIVIRINRANTNNLITSISDELNQRLKTPNSDNLEVLIHKASTENRHILILVDEAQQITKDEIKAIYEIIGKNDNFSNYFKFLLIGHEDLNEHFNLSQISEKSDMLSEHCRMLPLKEIELAQYIEHRLKITGWNGNPELDSTIFSIIFKITKGVPRRVNSFFDRFLLHLFIESKTKADLDIIKEFCQDLSNELENDQHPDLDSSDLQKALRLEKKEFERTQTMPTESQKVLETKEPNKPSTVNSEKKELSPPKISLVKTTHKTSSETEKPKARPKRILTSEQEKQGQLILMVSNYLENPERFKHYTDEFYKLPDDIGILLQLAIEKDINIEKALPSQLLNVFPLEVRRMIRHFLKRVLFPASSDPYRVLGLQSTASEKQINQHFDYLMRICRSDIGGPSEWSKNEEHTIKQAYIKILGSNSREIKQTVTLSAVPSQVNNTSEKHVAENSSITKHQKDMSSATQETHSTSDIIPVITATVTPPPSILPVSNNSIIQKSENPAIETGKIITAKADSDITHSENTNEHSFHLKKVQTKSTPWIPIAIVFCIIGAIAITVLLSGGYNESNDDIIKPIQQASIKKTDVPELKLLNQHDSKASNASDKAPEVNSESRVSKILSESNKKEPEPQATKIPEERQKQQIIKNDPQPVKKVDTKKTDSPPSPISDTNTTKAPQAITSKAITNTPVIKAADKKLVSINQIAAPNTKTEVIATKEPIAIKKPTQPIPNTAEAKADPPSSSVSELTDADLNRLIFYFKRSYESGDIDIFGGLFADDAITNESENLLQILRDYDALFNVTNKRNIQLDNLSWDKNGVAASGNGTFVLSIVEKEGMAPEEIRGEISIKVEKIDQKTKIKELFYRYSFAAN